jgi:hypothetical protein
MTGAEVVKADVEVLGFGDVGKGLDYYARQRMHADQPTQIAKHCGAKAGLWLC